MTERAYLTEIASRQCCRKAFSHNQDPKLKFLRLADLCDRVVDHLVVSASSGL
jgi:hypothetical protein